MLFDWQRRVIPAQTQKRDEEMSVFAALAEMDRQQQVEETDPIDRPLIESD